MGDLTKNLSRYEFNSSDGESIGVDYELVNGLQRRVGIAITSAYRSPEVNNKTPNAAKKSMHLFGKAADHFLYFKDNNKRIKPLLLYSYYDKKYEGKYGVSLYTNRVHFDVRDIAWRDARVKS